jgi:hypothetical protein
MLIVNRINQNKLKSFIPRLLLNPRLIICLLSHLTLAYIILHTEQSLYQPFKRKNAGMQAKKTFYFFIYQKRFCAPSPKQHPPVA